MAYYYFNSLMDTLNRMGVTDILLPFLLIFVLVFSTLEKTKILGVRLKKDGSSSKHPKTNLNSTIALVIGLGVVIPHATRSYPHGRDVVEIINRAIPSVAMFIVAIFCFLLLLGLFGGKQPNFTKAGLSGIGMLIILVAVIAIFIDATSIYRLPNWLYFLQDPGTQAGLIVILVFGGLIWFITREDSPDKDKKDDSSSE